jgi:hypothetical protein
MTTNADLADRLEALATNLDDAQAELERMTVGGRSRAFDIALTCRDRTQLAFAEAAKKNLPAILAALRASRPEPAGDVVEAVAQAIAQAEGFYAGKIDGQGPGVSEDAKWAEHWRWYLDGKGSGMSADHSNQARWERMARAALAALPRPEAASLHQLPDDEIDAMWATIGETAPTPELRALVANYRAAGRLSKAAPDGETVPLPRPEADEGAATRPAGDGDAAEGEGDGGTGR